MEVLVGTGGWDYYPTSTEDRLKAYAKVFNFTEVNSTFYHIPRLQTVKSWRRRVPTDFVFSVKCNSIATHVESLRPIDKTFRTIDAMLAICRILKSNMIVLQTPSTLMVDKEKVKEVSRMLENLGMDNVKALWEIRTPMLINERHQLMKTMIDEGIVPISDLSTENAVEGSGLIYSRLFNRESLVYSDAQIMNIASKVKESKAERVILTFHGIGMYKDASRYLELGSD